jgi:AraC-like DNA-binding protein
MNKNEIVTVLYELHKITGFRISLHGANYEEIAAYPEKMLPFCAKIHSNLREHEKCLECDGKACKAALEKKCTHIYKCRYGLSEAVSPLYNFSTLTGFLMMGQIAESDEDVKRAERMLSSITSVKEAKELAALIPRVSKEMINSYVKIMTICAQYLTLSNAIPSEKPTVAELAKKYISDNIGRKLCISEICDNLGCSKSTLLTTFKSKYGITVNTYITEQRLNKATHLLCEGNMTISEIASETGFSDQSYFSKVSSAKFGTTPSEYRIKEAQ